MIKIFCDCCGAEYDKNNSAFRPFDTWMNGGSDKPMTVRMPSADNKYPNGYEMMVLIKCQPHTGLRARSEHQPDKIDICPSCIWEAVNKADPREKTNPLSLDDRLIRLSKDPISIADIVRRSGFSQSLNEKDKLAAVEVVYKTIRALAAGI